MRPIKRAAGVFIVMNGVGLGVAVFLQTHLGSDPIGMLCEGIHKSFHIQFGHASLLYNLLLIGIAFACSKRNLGLGSIAYALLSGYFIDFYSWLLSSFQLAEWTLAVRFFVFMMGLLVFTMSLAVLIRFKLGMNALDALLYQLSEFTKIPYAVLRFITDFFYLMAGYRLGGTIGIGSVLCAVASGFLIKSFTDLLSHEGRPEKYRIRRFTSNEV